MILHIIRCDGPQCTKEQPLESIQARQPGARPEYRRPANWPEADGRDFCSYGCMATYGVDRQQHPEKYEPIGQVMLRKHGPW